jgi:hypothetical protein
MASVFEPTLVDSLLDYFGHLLAHCRAWSARLDHAKGKRALSLSNHQVVNHFLMKKIE